MSITIKAHYDGKVFIPDEPLELETNQQVKISLSQLKTSVKNKAAKTLNIRDMPIFGMWKDRKDIDESIDLVNEERNKW